MGIGVDSVSAILYIAIILVLFFLGFVFIKIFNGSIKFIIKIVMNSVLAGGLLYGFNFILADVGIVIPITIPVIIICALLGVPGFVFIFLTTFFF